ncbi:unnamed protein product [Rhizophagus irregularis]|nr:unnamed protein product [Rhizophagus irregularis]
MESIPDVPSNIAEEIVKYGNKNLRITTIVGLYEYWYTVALFGACIYILILIFYISDVPSYASSERAVLKNAKKIDRKENRWHCVFDRKLHEMEAIEGTRSYTGFQYTNISKE